MVTEASPGRSPRHGPAVRRRAAAAGAVALVVLLPGCGSAQDGTVQDVAARFYAAVQARDGTEACRLLSTDTRQELTRSSGTSCPMSVLEEDLPRVTGEGEARVFSTTAQVRYRNETAFLARFQDGWKVMAAGCHPQPEERYDCLVKGG